jgi:hypothetical protein
MSLQSWIQKACLRLSATNLSLLTIWSGRDEA